MKLEDLFGLLVPASFFALLGLEALFPARAFPPLKRWRLLGIGMFLVMGALTTIVPLLIPVEFLAQHRLIDLSGVGLLPGVVLGYLAVSLAGFAWHRLEHRVDLLWRWAHQVHHSPARVDLVGAAVFHPNDMIAYAALSTLVTAFVLGLSPETSAVVGFVTAFYAFFQHLNMRTPQWLGYLIQRPESHCVHHERGVHAWNYSDLPLWDLVFGTFKNPKTWAGEAGFGDTRLQWGRMLLGRDVSPSQSSASEAGPRAGTLASESARTA